jgi:hypothetical protein
MSGRFVSIFCTRTDSKRCRKIRPHEALNAVRNSLVWSGSLTYPGFQPRARWTLPEVGDGGCFFSIERASPPVDLQLQQDGTWIFTRATNEEENGGPVLFLEALVWELTLTFQFARNMAKALDREGQYEYGFTVSGFDGGFVDWSGFWSKRMERIQYPGDWRVGVPAIQVAQVETVPHTAGSPGVWRFRPTKDPLTTFVSDIQLRDDPPPKFPVAQLVGGISEAIVAESRAPDLGLVRHRLVLTPESIEGAIQRAHRTAVTSD